MAKKNKKSKGPLRSTSDSYSSATYGGSDQQSSYDSVKTDTSQPKQKQKDWFSSAIGWVTDLIWPTEDKIKKNKKYAQDIYKDTSKWAQNAYNEASKWAKNKYNEGSQWASGTIQNTNKWAQKQYQDLYGQNGKRPSTKNPYEDSPPGRPSKRRPSNQSSEWWFDSHDQNAPARPGQLGGMTFDPTGKDPSYSYSEPYPSDYNRPNKPKKPKETKPNKSDKGKNKYTDDSPINEQYSPITHGGVMVRESWSPKYAEDLASFGENQANLSKERKKRPKWQHRVKRGKGV